MGKIILVTGGNRGIGKEICKQLAESGHIVLLGSRSLEAGQTVAKSIGHKVKALELDVTNQDQILKVKNEILDEFGKLDVLINNAGIINNKTAFEVGLEEVQAVMDTNVYGPWRMIKALVPLLQKSDDPRIVNVSSDMGALSNQKADHSAYRLSKFTLNGLTLQLASELTNIKINAMHPGWIKTDMGGSSAPGEVEDGADTAVWLATNAQISTGEFYSNRKIIRW